METEERDLDSVLEILDGGSGSWRVTPGEPAEYPICIRNGTSETHNVDVAIAGPIDWAHVNPRRIVLQPGAQAITHLALAIQTDSPVEAGNHEITLELLDFEGTCFGRLVRAVDVRPCYQLEMSLFSRGPLIRRELIEGFVLLCTIVNHGNIECAVKLDGDGGEHVTLKSTSVTVPLGAKVSFDIEAHWKSGPIHDYPKVIKVRAHHARGEASVELAWDKIEPSLRPFVPPLEKPAEFPNIVAWRAPRDLAADEAALALDGVAQNSVDDAPASIAGWEQQSTPVQLEIRSAARPQEPVAAAERSRPLLIWIPLLVVIALLAATFAFEHKSTSALTPYVGTRTNFLGATLRLPKARKKPLPIMAVIAHKNVHARSAVRQTVHHNAVPDFGLPHYQRVALAPALPHAVARHVVPRGAAWEGQVTHVSASNIKVYGTAERTTRSFIVSANFKSVFSADGAESYTMSAVRPGAVVRVFYSYVFGFRHPNAIFIIRAAPRSRR